MRYSRQRELIKNIIKNRFDHPTVDMIYNTARETEPNISLGTAYRNLKSLVEMGEVDTLETTDKRLHYDGDTSFHSHFICLDCGKIVDLFEDNHINSELEKLNYQVESSKCVYYGYCDGCKNKNVKA